MAENVEEIEAKLAAYVDGELTPAERVEIETHLEANPSHRLLLQDLVQHRQLLCALPREKATGDFTEGFQGQLEREILLGGDELSRARSRFRISYSPQLLSAAAIVLLAVALAIIVFSVLPPHHPKAPLAQLTEEPPRNTELASGDGIEAKAYKPAGEFAAKKGVADATLALKDAKAVESDQYFAMKAKSEGAQGGEMMVITVTAEDLKGANEAVVSYLALNGINYSAADALLRENAPLLDAVRQVPAIASGAVAQAKLPAQMPAVEDEVGKRDELATQVRATPRPVDASALAEVAEPLEDQPQPTAGRALKSAAPSTQPTAVALQRENRGLNEEAKASFGGAGGGGQVVFGGGDHRRLRVEEQVRLKQQVMETVNERSGARVILAHNMNGQQVRELARTLSQPERGRWATVTDVAYDRLAGEWGGVDFAEQQLGQQQLSFRGTQTTESLSKFAHGVNLTAPTTRPSDQVAVNINPAEAGLTLSQPDTAAKNGTIITNNTTEQYTFNKQLEQTPARQTVLAVAPATQPHANLFACYIVLQPSGGPQGASAPTTQPTAAARPTTAPTSPTAPPAAAQPATDNAK